MSPMSPMSPTRPMGPHLPPRASHTLPQSTLLEEITFKPADLLVQKEIRLVNQTDRNICHDLGRASLAEFTMFCFAERAAWII
jgi:hypothetical protein